MNAAWRRAALHAAVAATIGVSLFALLPAHQPGAPPEPSEATEPGSSIAMAQSLTEPGAAATPTALPLSEPEAPAYEEPVTARVVREFAAVHAGPGAEHALVWRLYAGTQVSVQGTARERDDGRWYPVRIWNSQDGWLDAEALSFEPFPPPVPAPASAPAAGAAAGGGPCSPRPAPAARGPEAIRAQATVTRPTVLADTASGPTGSAAVPSGETVAVEAWAVDEQGLVRYRVRAPAGTGWIAPEQMVMQAADPATRTVGGRPIVDPLRGKGIWFVLDSREHGTDAARGIAAAARVNGLSHLYVEVATSRGGFWGARWLDALLPAARAEGLRVIGSVYPCLDDVAADVALARQVAAYRTPAGLGIDGLTADIEETLVAANVQAYGELLRHYLGDDYLLVATVYPPESWFAPRYPWPALAASWNAIVPMAYWRQMENRAFTPEEVDAFTRRNLEKVRTLTGRADVPVQMLGQLFEMGRPGLLGPEAPTAGEIRAAAAAARDVGAIGISFFDWTRATPTQWEAIAALAW